MKHDGKDIEITINGKAFPVRSIEYSDKTEPPQLDRTPGVYVVRPAEHERHGRWYTLKEPRYPGEGNRQQRRAAAKGKVRR